MVGRRPFRPDCLLSPLFTLSPIGTNNCFRLLPSNDAMVVRRDNWSFRRRCQAWRLHSCGDRACGDRAARVQSTVSATVAASKPLFIREARTACVQPVFDGIDPIATMIPPGSACFVEHAAHIN